MTDEREILAANAAFYTAMAMGDIAAMARVWADDDGLSCIHPGWPAIIGRGAVLASWRDILANGAPPITCHQPQAIVAGEDGRVLCIEVLGAGALAASNHFRRIAGLWRLVHHQASPIAAVVRQAAAEDPSPSRRVH